MARIRSIHYNACKSEKLDAATAEAERCYWRLLPHCDDEGRAEDDPRNLRSLMFPVAEPPLPAKTVDGWLAELDRLGLILRYSVGGKRYLVVMRWHDFQKPQHPKDSILPPPPESFSTPHEASPDCAPVVVVGEGEGDVVGEVAGGELALPPSDPVTAIFTAWQDATKHHKAVLSPERRRAIVKARRHYSDDDLIDACRGVALVPHNNGATNGTRYDDLELVLRDSAHIERFRDTYRGQGARGDPRLDPLLGGIAQSMASEAIDV